MRESTIHYRRLIILIGLLLVGGLALIYQMAQIQLVRHNYYNRIAQNEHWGKKRELAHRGVIRDRNGHPLAMTTTVYDLYVVPGSVKSPEGLAKASQTLSSLLRVPAEKVLALYAQDSPDPVLLEDNVSYDLGTKVMGLGLPGLLARKEARRSYPEGSLAANLIGFVGKDQKGLLGIEADYNGLLAGRSGTVIFERDSMGNEIPLGFRERVPPQGGSDLFLTIDRFIQRLAERELDRAVKKHQASGGTIIVMDPQTGAILAMANRPTFDLTKLNLKDASEQGRFRNRAITDLYEPGSTFKVITMAAALDAGKVTPKDTLVDKGYVVKYGWTITNWDGRGNGLVDMTEVLKYSINVGAVWVSDRVGPKLFYDYVKLFGFGQPTNIDLAGEVSGHYRSPQDKGWSPVDMATNSFGQGISVTPLQMITAVSAVANGGRLMRPYVVEKVVGPKGIRVFRPVEVRRVLSPQTSKTLTKMLEKVVDEGLTKLARVPGYRMAGKTGTAQVAGEGGYTGSTIASFIGYGPIEDPRFIMLIKIDHPKDQPWGSVVAAPIFKSMSQQMLVYMRVPPSQTLAAAPSRGVGG
jgi:cell division protein FtsI/penicillin-binding protein 2